MTSGLNIDKTNFECLTQKQQNNILYKNTEEIKDLLKSYYVHRKIQYYWLLGLSIAVLGWYGIKLAVGI